MLATNISRQHRILKLFNEIVNRFYQNHLQDQIQTLQSGKISVAQQDLLRAQHEQ
jgi:hypothetical protein